MSAALDLLVRLHDGGVRLRAVSDEELEYEGPEDLVTDEVVENLRRHKTDLLKLLKWNEEGAYALIQEALRSLAKHYVEDSNLSALGPWEDRMSDAYVREDMGSLRAAVQGFVRAGLASFGDDEDA